MWHDETRATEGTNLSPRGSNRCSLSEASISSPISPHLSARPGQLESPPRSFSASHAIVPTRVTGHPGIQYRCGRCVQGAFFAEERRVPRGDAIYAREWRTACQRATVMNITFDRLLRYQTYRISVWKESAKRCPNPRSRRQGSRPCHGYRENCNSHAYCRVSASPPSASRALPSIRTLL
jgi:hypothetical protein